MTTEERNQIVQEVLTQIKAASQGVNELEEVTTLDGVKSLPAMKGDKVVSAPVSLLGKPATDAAAVANSAAATANESAGKANSAATLAASKAEAAETAAQDANSAAEAAQQAATQYEATAEAALKGATARFDGFVDDATIQLISVTSPTAIIYVRSKNLFAAQFSNGYASNWSGADSLLNENRTEILKDKTYICGDTLYVWSEEKGNLVVASGGSGTGSGFYNVTQLHPLSSGYYTKETAIAALTDADIDDEDKQGMIITFEENAGKWVDYRFAATSVDSFLSPGAWEEYGGAGAVKQITFNGEKKTPDEAGNVAINVDVPQIDESLDLNSTNPVQNAAITAKLNEVDAGTLFGSDVTENDDNTVTVSLKSKSATITEFTIPAGGGGGGETGSTTKIVLSSSVDNAIIKEGGSSVLTYTYDHQYSGGDEAGQSTGQRANITVTMKRGVQTVFSQIYSNVAKGSYTLDISKYLFLGTTDIYVKAEVTDIEGKKQTKQAYTSVKVVTLSLSTSYNLANKIAQGGYGTLETVSIPYTVSGAGTKTVTLYVDGKQQNAQTVTKSGVTNGNFNISMSTLAAGRHTVQMVAEMEASDDLTIKSESIYIDILKAGSYKPFIGTLLRFPDGRIFATADHLTPTIEVGQYEKLEFEFIAYDPDKTPADMSVFRDNVQTQTVSVPRTVQIYTNRYTAQGKTNMRFECGTVQYQFYIDVKASSIDIEEITAGQVLKLSAAGRSNTEGDPAKWEYNGIKTTFNKFDWSGSGWTGETLKMQNGANIEIGYKPFATDATPNGATYEFELSCSNITDKKGIILSCMEGGIGFQMTAEEVKMVASNGSSVNTPFVPDMNFHISFVVQKKTDTRLLELYVNGVRCGVKQYAGTESLLQQNPVNITVSSDAADVDMRSIRVYEKPLTDDEILVNFMVDRETVEEMVTLYNANDVMDDEGVSIDIEKLRAQGKSVLRIVGDVELVNQTNNKKFEVSCDIYFYSAYGKEYDFEVHGAGLRIQGTSSTTYPRKNYRIYFDRKDKYGTTLTVNGVDVPSLEYSFKPGARPVKIWCLKADFSDSSSTHNTGAVRLVNDVWKKCGFLTPPQAAYTGNYDLRIGVDGFPCDGFYDNDGSGTNKYLGKFNFNNEKSDSHIVYGFEGIEGFNDEATLAGQANPCICLEFLNNSKQLCLFSTSDMTEFDDSLEFRFPADVTWGDATTYQKNAITRLWSWIVSVRNDTSKFKSEVNQYFDVNSLCAWYLFTDYFMAVDQRAKNMMLATWDGLKWYFLPYDADTILGSRNDSVLAYTYIITHETFDDTTGAYAFAGHDSVLWELVREGLKEKLVEVAGTIRSNMSTDEVLTMFNVTQMGNWSERVYNKDGYFKYIQPLTEGVSTTEGTKYYDYLYALQGSRYAHRLYTIKNRFALMDAQYVAGTYRADSFTCYFGYKFSQSPRKVKITASERYYFGYGYTSGTPTQSAVLAAAEGSKVELTISTDLIVNDPQYFYGASRIRDLDLTNVSHAILQTLNLNNCTALRTLNISCGSTQKTLNALIVSNCKNLQSLTLNGLLSESLTNMDLSNNAKLEVLAAGNTALKSVTFAKGAPLASVVLPATIQTLELTSLNSLTNNGLQLEGTDNISRLVIDDCSLLDWLALFNQCSSVQYLRVTGIDMKDDGTLLNRLMQVGGVDENGGNTPTCRLVGKCQLTTYIDDDTFAEMQEHFPELQIKQPECTIIKHLEHITDGTGFSNLDNKTGYDYDNAYVPSGHVERILAKRYRCLGKKTANGEETICKLHDQNSNYFADAVSLNLATPAILTGADGDVWMYEPHYWYKGVNDFLNKTKYRIFSSLENEPTKADSIKLMQDELEVKTGYAVRIGTDYNTLSAAETQVSSNSYYKVNVKGYKQVRFPGLVSAVYGALFLDANGNIIERMKALTDSGIINGMYLFNSIPENATQLVFTVANNADFDYVLLTHSEEIEAIEPDWCEHEECLTGVYEALLRDDMLYSISGVQSTATITQPDFKVYARNRGTGFKLVDWEMHKDVCNLFYAKYGNTDSQGTCGPGTHTNGRATGASNATGMQDTKPTVKDGDALPTVENNYYPNGNAYVLKNAGDTQRTAIGSPVCMGYENWYGNKAEWIDDTFNEETVDYSMHITMPDGSIRKLKGETSTGDRYPMNVVNGRHMDVWVARAGGSTTSYYYDLNYVSGSTNRVVCRSGSNANAGGGVAYASTSLDSTNTSANIGSRLAFRGKIVIAKSVAAFKAISEVA